MTLDFQGDEEEEGTHSDPFSTTCGMILAEDMELQLLRKGNALFTANQENGRMVQLLPRTLEVKRSVSMFQLSSKNANGASAT